MSIHFKIIQFEFEIKAIETTKDKKCFPEGLTTKEGERENERWTNLLMAF